VQVLVAVDITGYGRVDEGVQDLPEDLATLLVERGFATPAQAEDSVPEDSDPGIRERRKSRR
jgi:hypothetical protein